jgi:hypothetical protein
VTRDGEKRDRETRDGEERDEERRKEEYTSLIYTNVPLENTVHRLSQLSHSAPYIIQYNVFHPMYP